MSAIFPNGTLHLLKGVQLDKSYNHTYRFTNESQQHNFFHNYTKPNEIGINSKLISYTLYNQSYQRHSDGSLRVGIGCDYLLDINYMMFQNNIFGIGKWFYAFVDRVEYINPNCTAIYFTIDVMQTWYFDYEAGECLVEREHVADDTVGKNIVPENFTDLETYIADKQEIKPEIYNLGDITLRKKSEDDLTVTYDDVHVENATSYYHIIVYYTINTGGAYLALRESNEILGCNYRMFPIVIGYELFSGNTVEEFIENTIKGGGGVINMVVVPSNMFVGSIEQIVVNEPDHIFASHLEGHYAINNKLLTYPYTYIEVWDYNQKSTEYKFENFFSLNGPRFYYDNTISLPVQHLLRPSKYMDESIDPTNYYSVSSDEFLSLPWNEDSYQNYILQHSNINTAKVLNAGITGFVLGLSTLLRTSNPMYSALAGVLAGNTGMLTSAISIKAEDDTAKYNTKDIHNQSKFSGDIINIKNLDIGFCIITRKITGYNAKIIDNYFNLYGYAVNEVKRPQFNSRPYWNYVKTSGAIIHAVNGKGLSAEDENIISKIYDNGITFWNPSIDIGDYSYAEQNRPT